jgi:hypothetical protein
MKINIKKQKQKKCNVMYDVSGILYKLNVNKSGVRCYGV